MHARVTTLEVPPERTEDATRHLREEVLPQLGRMEGFRGFVGLLSKQGGKQLGVAFWESEEALRASAEAVVSVREGTAEAAGGTVAGVEEFEVNVYEAPSAGPVSGVTDTVGGVTDTVGGTVGGATDSVRGVTDKLLGGEEKQR